MWEELLAAVSLMGRQSVGKFSRRLNAAQLETVEPGQTPMVMFNLNCQFVWISNHHGNTLLGISMRVFSEQFN